MEKDPELIRACLAGDAAAWSQLLARYERLIFSIPRAAGLDSDEAADVFQKVSLALHRGLPRLKSSKAITQWILTTTHRIARDHARVLGRTSRLHEGEDGTPLVDPPDPDPLTPEVLERLELQQEVRLALQGLDERCRRMLLLLFYTDPPPSYLEIAGELGIPVGSIGPSRARCFEKLKGSLK